MKKYKEVDLLEVKEVREEVLLNERSLEVLNKVKEIVWLGEEEVVTIHQVAEFYDVELSALRPMLQRHREEFNEDGLKVLDGEEIKDLKRVAEGCIESINPYKKLMHTYNNLTVFTRRAVLRMGMLLRDSEVARTVRNYLLNVEEVATEEQREWAIKREAGKLIRKQMTEAISYSGENKRMKGFAYPNYTNLVYEVVFGVPANTLYKYKQAPKGKIREYMTEDEIEAIRLVENTVAGLINVGMEYREIKKMLLDRFNRELIRLQ